MKASTSVLVCAVFCALSITSLASSAAAQTYSLGNRVWLDADNSGTGNNSEMGIDGVSVALYAANNLTTALATEITSDGGYYLFEGLAAGDYVVRLPATNFNPAGILRDYRSSTGPLPAIAYEPAPDPDADLTDSDDNGTEMNGLLGFGGYIQSAPVTLSPGDEAIESGVDFGVNNSPQIDLVVTKTDGQAAYLPGETLHYVINVTNNGPADANGMTVHDDRPAQIASWTWTCAPGTPVAYNCTGDASNPAAFTDSLDLPQLATVTYNVAALVATPVSGTLSNMVYVVPPPGMTDMTNQDNVATDADAPGAVDLMVSKTDDQTSYLPAGTVNYTIVVTNNGPGDANGMTVSDARPPQVATWAWTCDAGTPLAYGCTGDGANPATFTDSLDLPAFASVTYHVTAQIADSVSGAMTNSVQVTAPAGIPDTNPSNNEAVDVDVLAETTLAVTKTVSPNPALPGEIVTYTVQVANAGSVNATNLTVTDALPNGVSFISVSGDGWTCNEAGGVVSCTRALLAPGQAPPVLIRAQLPASRDGVTNTATVSAGNAAGAAGSVGTALAPSIPMLDGMGMAVFVMLIAGTAVGILALRRG